MTRAHRWSEDIADCLLPAEVRLHQQHPDHILIEGSLQKSDTMKTTVILVGLLYICTIEGKTLAVLNDTEMQCFHEKPDTKQMSEAVIVGDG